MMNEKKVCFIRCIRDESLVAEQDYYLSQLLVPDGFEIEVMNVTDAESMCEGYNEAMNVSDAKYKIYLHEDVFIIERDFIKKILSIFSDTSIGMVGLSGNIDMGFDCIPTKESRIQNVYVGYADRIKVEKSGMDFDGDYKEVDVLDGFILATQTDVKWRSDIFKEFELYDVSHCFEMRRSGYKVVVAKQHEPWIIRDKEAIRDIDYFKWLKVFRKEYKEDLITEEDVLNTTPIDILNLIPIGGTKDISNILAKTELVCEVAKREFNPNKTNYNTDYYYLKNYYGNRVIKTVLSAIFIPAAAKFCYEKNIPYISWIYDSPQQALFYPEASYDTNQIYIFDKSLCERALKSGCKNVSYMPCASVMEYKDNIKITKNDLEKYACDISFVGQLYNGDDFLTMFDGLADKDKKSLEDYYLENKLNWSKRRSWPRMPQDLCERLGKSAVADTMTDELFYGTAVMSRKLAQIERIEVLNYLAKIYDVHLFTGSDTSELRNVKIHPKVDYYTDAKKVFALTKINLNITLPSIETGVPWRVFDIMGMGGFVLTNYQEEVEELFEIDKDIVVFRNLEELKEKVEYYLSHDAEREMIAKNGFEKVKNNYNLADIVEKMYKKVVD